MANKKQRRQKPTNRRTKRKAKASSKLVYFNPASIGLVSVLNQDLAPKKPQRSIVPVEWESLPPKPSKPRSISDFDRDYIVRLTSKYGQDFEKMFWDRKLNCDQLTATQLKNLWNKLNESSSEDV